MSEYDRSQFDRDGLDALTEPVGYPYSQTVTNPYLVRVLDADLNYIGAIKRYTYFGWSARYYDVDSFTLKINTAEEYTDLLKIGNWIVYDAGFRAYIGRIENAVYSLDTDSRKEMLEISGRDVTGAFGSPGRILLAGTDTGTGYDNQTSVAAETAIRHYVDVNCISATDVSRNYPHLTLQTDFERGAVISVSGRFDILLDKVSEICKATGLGFGSDFVADPDTNAAYIEFVILSGSDHTYDSVMPVMFSPKFNNLKSFTLTKSAVDSGTLAYVAGQGEAAARTVEEVYVASSEPTGFGRREIFKDRRDSDDTDELITAGQAELRVSSIETSISAEILASGAFEYGTDYMLGDIVSLIYRDEIYDVRVVEVLEEITTKNKKDVTLTLGKPLSTLSKYVQESTAAGPGARQ